MISIYVIQIILILVFGYLFRDNKKRFLIAAFLVLFVVMAFRHARMVGYDSTSSYYTQYIEITGTDLRWPNPGLQVIMKVLHYLKADYQWVIIITALWVCFAYYKLLVKYSENGFISVMWFMGMLFYTFMFSALKQAWAMAFLCFAFDAIMMKKPVRFVLLVGLAVLFHFPALVFLPAYLFAKLRLNRSFPILMFSIFIAVFIFRTQILEMITSTYVRGEGDYSSDVKFFGTKSILMVLMLAYGFYCYFKYMPNKKTDMDIFSVLIYFMGISAVVQTFCYYSNIFERLADYYYVFSILYVPLILSRKDYLAADSEQTHTISDSKSIISKSRLRNYTINDFDINTIIAIVIVVFCIWRYTSNMTNDALMSPFYFFWDNVNVSMRFR